MQHLKNHLGISSLVFFVSLIFVGMYGNIILEDKSSNFIGMLLCILFLTSFLLYLISRTPVVLTRDVRLEGEELVEFLKDLDDLKTENRELLKDFKITFSHSSKRIKAIIQNPTSDKIALVASMITTVEVMVIATNRFKRLNSLSNTLKMLREALNKK